MDAEAALAPKSPSRIVGRFDEEPWRRQRGVPKPAAWGTRGRFSTEKRNADQADRSRFGRIGLRVGIDPRQSALIRFLRVSCFGLSNERRKDDGQPVWVSRR